MSIPMYSALMKIYASCGMFDKACDLYTEILECGRTELKILERGLKPDSIMYGCLMRFAAECGRTELTDKIVAAVA